MEIPSFLYGSIAPTFTIFKENGEIDIEGQSRLLDYMLEKGGVSAFFVRSGMGQMYTFSFDEVKLIADLACRKVKGYSAVLVGCSGIWDRNFDKRPPRKKYIQESIELSKYAKDIGADGVVLTIPEAIAPEGNETISDVIVKYFEEVCGQIDVPVLFYQPPTTIKEYCLTPEIIKKLAKIDNLIGGKVSTADGGYLFDLGYAVKDENFSLIVGNETVFYAGVMLGCRACIGQGATMNPKIINSVVDRYLRGDLGGALSAQNDVNILVRECRNAVEFFKRYISEKGYPVSIYSRRTENNPYIDQKTTIAPEEYERFKRIYEAILARY
ncbi:MAG: dihydrodipicolinate synthase family protein [Candidatus Hydrogenedentes bacterium]|nr:dihydrodipicolinate synthase family protein [Candidatus Hydrogenedentota bacterium]